MKHDVIRLDGDILQPGTKVRFLKDIYHDADDHSPFFYFARKGQTGHIAEQITRFWDYNIIFENKPLFGVKSEEIEQVKFCPNCGSELLQGGCRNTICKLSVNF